MLLDLGKVLSLLSSIVSLYYVAVDAFFVPGTRWEDRLSMSIAKVGLAACVCFASGILFSWTQTEHGESVPLMSTLPVRMFLWTVVGVAILFAVSWYLDAYYVPLLWRNQP